MSLRIGFIDYLNCVPFFRYLNTKDTGDLLLGGSPAQLNALLARGELDVCPASSFEYGCHWQDYLLLPDLSISSVGPVRSVLLFAPRPLAQLADAPIALTGESATSVHLLQILLREYCGFDRLNLYHPECPVEEVIARKGAGLLIGDRALKAARSRLAPHILDLGALWHAFCGLPFVFALWLVRRDVAKLQRDEVHGLQCRLQDSLTCALADLPGLARQVADPAWISAEALQNYWRDMSYSLTTAHLQGLERFFQLAVKYRLLESSPELRFFPPPFSVDPCGRID